MYHIICMVRMVMASELHSRLVEADVDRGVLSETLELSRDIEDFHSFILNKIFIDIHFFLSFEFARCLLPTLLSTRDTEIVCIM